MIAGVLELLTIPLNLDKAGFRVGGEVKEECLIADRDLRPARSACCRSANKRALASVDGRDRLDFLDDEVRREARETDIETVKLKLKQHLRGFCRLD